MECWICKTKGNLCVYCDCENDFKYVHTGCIMKWYIIYEKKKCQFCNKNYKIPYYYKFLYKIIYFINEILEYDLHNGVKWNDYD